MATKRDVSIYVRAHDRAAGVFRRLGGVIRGFARRITSMGAAMLGVAGIAGLGLMIRNSLKTMDAVGKLSDRIEVATEDIVRFRHAAQLSGVATEQMDKALEMFVRRLGEARQGTGEALRALEELGISERELIPMGTAEAFQEVAERISKLPTAAQKAAAAYQLFGRQGVKLLNLLQAGKKGIAAMTAEADRLGITFSRVEAKKVEEANDALLRAKQVITGVFQKVTVQLAPVIQALAESFSNMGADGAGSGEMIVNAFEGVAMALAKTKDAVRDLGLFFKGLWAGMVSGAAKAWRGLTDLAMKTPDWMLAAGGMPEWALKARKTHAAEMQAYYDKQVADMEGYSDKLMAEIQKAMSAPTSAEELEAWFERLRKRSAELAKAYEEAARKRRALAASAADTDALAKQAEGIEKAMAGIRKQIETFGMTAGDKALLELDILGATPEQFAEALRMIETLEALQEQAAEKAKKKIAEVARPVAALESRFLTHAPGQRDEPWRPVVRQAEKQTSIQEKQLNIQERQLQTLIEMKTGGSVGFVGSEL